LSRSKIYPDIDKELEFQCGRFGIIKELNTIEDFASCIQLYVDAAVAMSKSEYPLAAVSQMKKIAALSVACIERYTKQD